MRRCYWNVVFFAGADGGEKHRGNVGSLTLNFGKWDEFWQGCD